MERVLMLEQHREPVEGGFLTFQEGQFYNVEEPLRQSLIDAKKAVPESEHVQVGARVEPEVLAVPAPPEVPKVPEGVLDNEVTNG